jgi:hypothetical protein
MAEKSVNIEQVKKMIVEATEDMRKFVAEKIMGLGSVEVLSQEFITEDRVRELITDAQNEMFKQVNAATLSTIVESGEPEKAPLDPAWLEGLEFRGSKQEKKIVNGRPKLTGKSFTRPLTPEDVLSYLVTDDQVTIVAADGRKHTIEI